MPKSPKEPILPKLPGSLRFVSQMTWSASLMTSYLKCKFVKFTLMILRLVKYSIIHIGFLLYVVKLLINWKNWPNYEVISNAHKKLYFCPNIAESVNIAEIFWQKTFGDIGPPLLYVFNLVESKTRKFSVNPQPVGFKYFLANKIVYGWLDCKKFYNFQKGTFSELSGNFTQVKDKLIKVLLCV